MIDFSKVAVGDKVLIEATVVQKQRLIEQVCPIQVQIQHQGTSHLSFWPNNTVIVSHIPRGPEVGDEVSLGQGGVSRFQVIGIEGDEAWLRRIPDPVSGCQRTTVYKLSDLTVTKRKSAE